MQNKNVITKVLTTRSFLGHRIEKTLGTDGLHPSINQYLLGKRKKLAYVSLNSTLTGIINCFFVILSIIGRKGHILIVNTNPEIRNIVNHFKSSIKDYRDFFSFCNGKWVGGTLSNWNQISHSIITFNSFSKRFGNFLIQNNIYFPKYRKLKKSFQGFLLSKNSKKNDKKLKLKKPDIIVVINPHENSNVLNEAKKLNIPVIALVDTTTNLSLVTYPIPVNNHSPFFIQFFFRWISRLLKSTYKN